MLSKNPKLIIFDWDDVFVLGAKNGYIKCLHDTLVDLGVKLTQEEEHKRILETWSQPHENELKNLLREYPELVERACKIYLEKLFGNTFIDCLTYVDGANDLLIRLARKYKLAIATGAHPKILKDMVMPRFNVPNVFSQIISGYDITDNNNHKPSPYMLNTIMDNNYVTRDETIYVGDAKTDVIMARNAEVEPVVVLTGHLNRKEAMELGVENIINNVTLLPQVLP